MPADDACVVCGISGNGGYVLESLSGGVFCRDCFEALAEHFEEPWIAELQRMTLERNEALQIAHNYEAILVQYDTLIRSLTGAPPPPIVVRTGTTRES